MAASSIRNPYKNLFFRIIIPIIFVFMTAVLACREVYAEDTETRTVRIGFYENELFQEGAAEGVVKTGYAYEYYRKLSEYTGWRYDYVYGSFADLYHMLLDGEIDLLAGLAWTEERTSLIAYPEAAMGSEIYSLVKHDTDVDINPDPETLAGQRIGVLDSVMVKILNDYLENKNIKADVRIFPDYNELFAAFEKKDIDVFLAEGDGAHDRAHAEVINAIGATDYYLCVSRDRTDLLDELNEAQTQLFAEEPNYLTSLRMKYYPVSLFSRALSLSEKEWVAENSTFRLGYLNNYLPYSDTDRQGNVTGMIREIMPLLLESLNINDIAITYQGYDSYDRMIEALNGNEIDAAFPVGGGLYYSEENGIYQSNAVVSASRELVYKGDYSEETVSHFAVNENNRMQYYYIRTNFPDAEITYYSSIEDCLAAIDSGEAVSTTLNGLRANDILKNSKYRRLSHIQLGRNDDRSFGVKIGNEGLLKLLNRGINIIGSDYAQSLALRYTEQLYTMTVLDFVREHMALFGSFILAVAIMIIYFLDRDRRRTRKQIEEEERSRRELEAKNRELEENREALAVALAAAEQANHAKTTFLNNMSHDIRTPMNAIVGFTALAASHIDNKEQVEDYLRKISVSSQHLLSLINDVLDMSRIESGKVRIEETETHLPDLIHDLRTIIQPNITAKQLELFIDTQDVHNEDIITDKLRLSQILLNILSNAIKFTQPGGMISFRVIEKLSHTAGIANFEFCIKDNGIGMGEDFQNHIFEAFSREKTSTVSGIQGTGLGMAITKNIVDMMGGTIKVNSAEGKGSEFIVNIPCKISDVPTKFEKLPELQGLRALVADDDIDTCLSVSSMLREIGMRPDWTTYGKEAVIRTKDALDSGDSFNAYIIDWMLPDLNGIETVRRIRKVIGDTAPIIILTAYDWSDIEEEAREAGVTAFCAKPIFLSELRDVLAQPYRASQEKTASDSLPDFTGKRVLLAEDNELNQQIAEAILTETGITVDIADDGSVAVEKVENAPAGTYDVILMDIQMPHMDGYSAAKQIRNLADKKKAQIPIIAVTANAFKEDQQTAIDAGMNGHLAKPYDIPKIMETLSEILK